MQDLFTGQPTRIHGRALLRQAERDALQHDHERRLEALARLSAAAEECGLRADSDRDLVLLQEDEVSLLESTGGTWASFGEAIRSLRALLPFYTLDQFGFPGAAENPLEEGSPHLRRIGGGVEAWAFAAETDGSVYKFYLPREDKKIGSQFGFRPGEETRLFAEARLGDNRALLEKFLLIHALDGMPTEVVGVTPDEGIIIAKQALGEPLPQGDDMSARLPGGLVEIPSRFLRGNRDHPRLFFLRDQPFLVADLHARNFVRGSDEGLHLIDLVAAPWPERETANDTLMTDWLQRVRQDPNASALPTANDDEL